MFWKPKKIANACLRALQAYKSGHSSSIDEVRRIINETQRKEGKGPAAKNTGLSDTKWQIIYANTLPYVSTRKAAMYPAHEDGDAVSTTQDDAIIMSDWECNSLVWALR
ncbi:hypothetical protein BT96DRAFT_942986 [Gymnopus androsaceus JB14]|uniref:Uncharacterized protein n=1 Tax=Gymnopus androsaceus JB14 TaxID=1447944 RepID=A0A6A4HAN5_9AGAR|nr:hypothetical protein BT96DRAFT_942986 [Gymnopus androsaceus JB14]